MAGFFLTIEGIEGSGKSTLINGLAKKLSEANIPHCLTREPGATPIGKAIRGILLENSNTALSPKAELFLFAADRNQHLTEVVRPALERGDVVVCDRYVHSSYAYQGYGRGLPLSFLRDVIGLATDNLLPDLVLLLDLDVEIGLERARKRAGTGAAESWSRFEADTLEFHKAIRAGFLELASNERERFAIIDASRSPDEILHSCWKVVSTKLGIPQ